MIFVCFLYIYWKLINVSFLCHHLLFVNLLMWADFFVENKFWIFKSAALTDCTGMRTSINLGFKLFAKLWIGEKVLEYPPPDTYHSLARSWHESFLKFESLRQKYQHRKLWLGFFCSYQPSKHGCMVKQTIMSLSS